MTDYPPEPWYLGGSLLVSAFLVPRESLPALAMPDGRRPLRWGGKVVVGTAFVRYVPGGVLEYDELLVALPSLPGPRVTIPQIWVDSGASMSGGRELWGIPKELAEFQRTENGASVEASMGGAAAVSATVGRRLLPGMRQLPLTTLQSYEGRRILSHNRVIGRMHALRASWTFDTAGPLGYLHGRTPFFSAAIRDASIVFGMEVERS